MLIFAREKGIPHTLTSFLGTMATTDEAVSRKTYYSIREVAHMFGVAESTLRYWETQFSQLRPRTTAQKVRMYTQKDIDVIRQIHSLVKTRGFKIASARKMLSQDGTGVAGTTEVLAMLTDVRGQLRDLKKQLDMLA